MRRRTVTAAVAVIAGLLVAAGPAGANGCAPGDFMIAGTVTDATTGLPLTQVTSVGITQLDGDFEDGEGTVLPASTWSACVPAGTYRIGFFADDYFLQWYDGAPTEELATPVSVTADVTGLDAALSPLECAGLAPTILGTVGPDSIVGTPGADVIVARAGDDTIQGRGGDDVICGDIGDDIILGGAGDDLIVGGYGDDDLRGNGGFDTADYRTAGAGVVVNLGAGSATGGHDTDTLRTIQAVIGSDFDDRLIGNAVANRLEGGPGDDRLTGQGGDDELFGQAGRDVLNGRSGDDLMHGGPGADRGTWIHSSAGVTVDLKTRSAAGDGADTVVSIEEVRGSNRADVLAGNARDNLIIGGPGDDLLLGRSGGDVLIGSGGIDEARGGAGSDLCFAETVSGCEL